MFETAQLWTFIAAGLLLNITPGPDVFYIIGRSVSQGRSAGIVSALGIGFGCLFHLACAALGLSAILTAAPLAYDLVRYAGAGYLIYLGLRTLASKSSATPLTPGELTAQPLAVIFRQGAVTNMLNPKVALFFLAFLPQFTNPARGPVPLQIATLGAIFIVNGTLVCIAYALGASAIGNWLRTRYAVSTWLNRAMGAMFLALGIKLARA